MLVLFETAAGYAIFKVLNEKKIRESDDLFKDFQDAESANKILSLQKFQPFSDTTDALSAAASMIEGKISKKLKKVLKKLCKDDIQDELIVADAKLGGAIKDKFGVQCISSSSFQELFRCIRSQACNLIADLPEQEAAAMRLGLAHSLSRYKLKFSPDKIDTMIVQAVSLLDDIDKELNNYVMRAREWYGWHFPELGKVVSDHLAFAKVVLKLGDKSNIDSMDLSDILPEDLERSVKDGALSSIGTDVSADDIENIQYICQQIVEMTGYRADLYDYLKNRMMAVAPNLTTLVGELVGARLISHAGSLLNLAKHPSSTVQILGAEKALFRALKKKHDTPKYGLLYHANLVGQSNAKIKGKVSRMLAAKSALAIRIDALGDQTDGQIGIEFRANLERRLKLLENQQQRRISGTGYRGKPQPDKYQNKSQFYQYDENADSTLPASGGFQKRKFDDGAAEEAPKWKKSRMDDSLGGRSDGQTPKSEPTSSFAADDDAEQVVRSPKQKKSKKPKAETQAVDETDEWQGVNDSKLMFDEEEQAVEAKPKKQKKKRKTQAEDDE